MHFWARIEKFLMHTFCRVEKQVQEIVSGVLCCTFDRNEEKTGSEEVKPLNLTLFFLHFVQVRPWTCTRQMAVAEKAFAKRAAAEGTSATGRGLGSAPTSRFWQSG